ALGLLLLDNARRDESPEMARDARRAFEEAPGQSASVSRRLIESADKALATLPAQRLRDAAERYRAALSPQARDGDPRQWARNQDDLAAVLLALDAQEPDQ